MSTVPAIEINNVSFSYEDALNLEDVSIKIEPKEFIGIIGPNGGGKTTLLRLILGFLKPQKGSVRIFGKPPTQSRKKIGYVPQFSKTPDDFPITVRDVVAMGVTDRKTWSPWILNPAKKNIIQDAMQQLDITDLAERKFGNLSGGQKQRTLIARALASKPSVLILDEPTASVDSRVEKDIYEILYTLNQNHTILLVSHDIGFVSTYIDRVVCVNRKIAVHHQKDIRLEQITHEVYPEHSAAIQHQCGL